MPLAPGPENWASRLIPFSAMACLIPLVCHVCRLLCAGLFFSAVVRLVPPGTSSRNVRMRLPSRLWVFFVPPGPFLRSAAAHFTCDLNPRALRQCSLSASPGGNRANCFAMGQRFLAAGSHAIVLLRLPVTALVCECLGGFGGLSTWPPRRKIAYMVARLGQICRAVGLGRAGGRTWKPTHGRRTSNYKMAIPQKRLWDR
jgi:hypothetical protein